MDSLESEVNTRPASNFIENFFSKLPIDSRFNKVEFQRFVPVTALDKTTTKIDFKLEKRDPPQCYLISKAIIEVGVTITTSDSTTLPATAKDVASCNNALDSLFTSVSMQINDQTVSSSIEDYPYKAYVANLLSFSNETKNANLQMQGWVNDTKRAMEIAGNAGFILRNQMWRKDMVATGDYRKEGCHFIGKLHHDLASCEKPLPPNTRVYFELKRTSNDFYLMCGDADTEKYQAIITSCDLYVPVAWLQAEILRELQVRLPKETVKYHFRRWLVRQIGIPINKSDHYSDGLFSESENPVRIFFMIVDSKAYNGNIHKNPFNFARKWTVTAAQREMNLGAEIETNEIQQQLNTMQGMINVLLSRSQGGAPPEQPEAGTSSGDRGKGPLTRKSSLQTEEKSMFEKITNLLRRRSSQAVANDDEDPDFEILNEQTEELLRFLREKNEQQRSPPTAPRVERPLLDVTKTFWLTKCQLEINSQLPGNFIQNTSM